MNWKRSLANIATYAGGDFLVLAVGGFLLVPLYTRHLSPSDYGVLVVTRTNSEVLTYIIQFGIISAVARVYYIFKEKQQHRKYISSLLIFYFISAVVLFIGFGIIGKSLWILLSPNVPVMPYMWFALGIAFFSYIPALFSILLRVEEKAQTFVIAQIASAGLLVFMAFLFLVIFKAGLAGVLWALVLCGFISSSAFLILLCRKLEWGFEWEHLQVSLKFGLPILISYIAYFFINRFGIIYLQRHVGLAEVGMFGLAQQLAIVISLASMAFGKSFQPMIYATDVSTLPGAMSRLSNTYYFFMLLIAATICCFASEILAIVAPHSYGHAYYVFILLVIANMIYSLKLMSECIILYRHHPNLSMGISIGGGILSVLSNILLVPKYGVYGAVFTNLFTAIAITIASLLVARAMVPFRIAMYVVWTGIAAVAIVALAVWMNGRMPMLHLVSLKVALLTSLGIVFLVLRFQSAGMDLSGAANRRKEL